MENLDEFNCDKGTNELVMDLDKSFDQNSDEVFMNTNVEPWNKFPVLDSGPVVFALVIENGHSRFQCPLCPKTYKNKSDAKKHLVKHGERKTAKSKKSSSGSNDYVEPKVEPKTEEANCNVTNIGDNMQNIGSLDEDRSIVESTGRESIEINMEDKCSYSELKSDTINDLREINKEMKKMDTNLLKYPDLYDKQNLDGIKQMETNEDKNAIHGKEIISEFEDNLSSTPKGKSREESNKHVSEEMVTRKEKVDVVEYSENVYSGKKRRETSEERRIRKRKEKKSKEKEEVVFKSKSDVKKCLVIQNDVKPPNSSKSLPLDIDVTESNVDEQIVSNITGNSNDSIISKEIESNLGEEMFEEGGIGTELRSESETKSLREVSFEKRSDSEKIDTSVLQDRDLYDGQNISSGICQNENREEKKVIKEKENKDEEKEKGVMNRKSNDWHGWNKETEHEKRIRQQKERQNTDEQQKICEEVRKMSEDNDNSGSVKQQEYEKADKNKQKEYSVLERHYKIV